MREELLELIEKFDMVNRAYEKFWENYDRFLFENGKIAGKNGLYDRNSIAMPWLREVKYELSRPNEQGEFETETIGVDLCFFHKAKKCSPAGYYSCWFDLKGEFADDCFELD